MDSSSAWTGPALLLAGYVLIVALLTAYTHWVWRGRSGAELTADAAAEAFRRELGGGGVEDVLLLADRRTALLRTTGGGLAVVGTFGRGWMARRLRAEDVRGVRRRGPNVTLRLRDYAHPSLTLAFHSAEAERAWLGGLLGARP